MSHEPVLLNEVLEYLGPKPGDFMIDGTMDGGGHATAIMEKISPGGKLLGVDWDREMVARSRLGSRAGATLVRGNYADLPEILAGKKFPLADGLLLDLGFSSEQIAGSGRGFSFGEAAASEPLLMTYDDSREPVREILRRIGEAELADIIYGFGGERFSRRIARAIKERGRRKPIETAGELAETVREALPKSYERGRIDPATRTFQALRIYANGEIENLTKILNELDRVLAPGGRAVIISFHSLEDGTVKRAFRTLVKAGKAELLTKKPVGAARGEILMNPRARTAKLRAIKYSPTSKL
ncbi:MAG TPA: 16S rRNA (cytosine(1402)-N(4))-methyltransferase RsmH [Candidatus Paceibacterota bacterium]|nr:16S rRNA (cytosine(1402)-N(4))-methyltransferase RsmH [Candidatus Paceibacterota bacterium]